MTGGTCQGAEEANAPGAIGVGFDVYQNAPGDLSANEVSINFNNALRGQFSAGTVNLASGQWIHARIVVRPGGGQSNVSVFLTPLGGAEVAIVSNFAVAGLVPFESRAYFGARTGGQSAHHDVTNVSVTYAGDPAVVGQWAAVAGLPVIPIHSVMLPNQKILFWDRASAGTDINPRLLNPDGTVVATPHPVLELFCAGHTLDAQGRAMIFGGHDGADGFGLATAFAYDHASNTFTSHAAMNAGRWYPTNTALANGDTLVISGSITPGVNNNTPQVFQAKTETWRTLTTAVRGVPLYPMMFLAPDGRVFNAGPNQSAQFLNTAGTGSWSASINSSVERNYGAAVMYDAGKVALIGGGYITNTVERIDLAAADAGLVARGADGVSAPPDQRGDPGRRQRAGDRRLEDAGLQRQRRVDLRRGDLGPAGQHLVHGRGGGGAAALPLRDRAAARRARGQPRRRSPGWGQRRSQQLQHGVLLAAVPVQGSAPDGHRRPGQRRLRPDGVRRDAGRRRDQQGARDPAGRDDARRSIRISASTGSRSARSRAASTSRCRRTRTWRRPATTGCSSCATRGCRRSGACCRCSVPTSRRRGPTAWSRSRRSGSTRGSRRAAAAGTGWACPVSRAWAR